jgi:hypothetical protein
MQTNILLLNQLFAEEFYLLEYNAALSHKSQLTFRRNISPPYSGSKSNPSKKPTKADDNLSLPPASAGFLHDLLYDSEDGGDMFL